MAPSLRARSGIITVLVFLASVLLVVQNQINRSSSNLDTVPESEYQSKDGQSSWKNVIGGLWKPTERPSDVCRPCSDDDKVNEDEAVAKPNPKKHAEVFGGSKKTQSGSLWTSSIREPLSPTNLLRHAPGFTLMDNVFMAGGTVFVVTDEPESKWPEVRLMTSTGGWAANTPENIASREPTSKDLDFISTKDAKERWGDRVWPVEGMTILVNDPGQFINHYYHFIAETWFGFWRLYASMDPKIGPKGETTLAPLSRIIFPHCNSTEWRDYSTFNQFVAHGVFPSLSIEARDSWDGRKNMTSQPGAGTQKVFRFDRLLLADRSASFRGRYCGLVNSRIAAESFEATRNESSRFWWEPMRQSVLKLALVDERTRGLSSTWAEVWDGSSNGEVALTPKQLQVLKTASRRIPVVITYVFRPPPRRSLLAKDHEALLAALHELCDRRKWELNFFDGAKLQKEEQITIAARTTVLLGVHGNGLTHLLWMPLTPISTVIEIYYPKGFARDYQWTSRALGMKHFGVWNDTYFTYPEEPSVDYPQGFHDDKIPVHAGTVVKLIEDRIEGRLP